MKIDRVLVVDDEPDNVETLEFLVNKLMPSCAIVRAEDGLRAYQLARNEAFMLIVTDFKMPKLNGVKLLSALRDSPFNKNCRMVVLSAFVDEAKAECERFNLNNLLFLEKPIDTPTFLKEARAFLDQDLEKTKTGTEIRKPPAIKLDVNFINPFLAAIQDTLTGLGGVKQLEKKALKPLDHAEFAKKTDIAGIIDIKSAHFKGRIWISFQKATFLSVAERMLNEKHADINDQNKDAAGELANIIYGQAKRVLNESGYGMEPSLPKVSLQPGTVDTTPMPGICVEYESDLGPLCVAIQMGTS